MSKPEYSTIKPGDPGKPAYKFKTKISGLTSSQANATEKRMRQINGKFEADYQQMVKNNNTAKPMKLKSEVLVPKSEVLKPKSQIIK